MSADKPLVKRIEEMLERARETREMHQSQVEDAVHKLSQLEMAQQVAKVLAYIDGGATFEMEFRVTGVPTDDGRLRVVCTGGTLVMAQMRTLIIALLNTYVACLAEV